MTARAASATATCSRTGGTRVVLRRRVHGKRNQRDDAASPRDHARRAWPSHGVATFKAMIRDPLYPCSIMADPICTPATKMQTPSAEPESRRHGRCARSCDGRPLRSRPVASRAWARHSRHARDPQKSADMCTRPRAPIARCYFARRRRWSIGRDDRVRRSRSAMRGRQPGGPTWLPGLGEEDPPYWRRRGARRHAARPGPQAWTRAVVAQEFAVALTFPAVRILRHS